MAVGIAPVLELPAVPGLRWGATSAGLRRAGRDDMALLVCEPGAVTAAVFTRNRFQAAPVEVARANLAANEIRALIVNSGCANAGTGPEGVADASAICAAVAARLGVEPGQVLPFSTGVIGERLQVARMVDALDGCHADLSEEGWVRAANAIMTTDTVAKGSSRVLNTDAGALTVTGIVKGAGMIRPDMATMLAFVGTDAVVDRPTLQGVLNRAVAASFHRITVDGDTSTNDACVLTASGRSGLTVESAGALHDAFESAVTEVLVDLAQAIVRDAEGATKFVEVRVGGGQDIEQCVAVAMTIAHSPLVKTALFASDPNWGRILAAVGRAPVPELAVERVALSLNGLPIVTGGAPDPAYTEQIGQREMARDELCIGVDLGLGEAAASVWTSDLSHDYVRINAEYRT